jgi:lysophospholipase L1-like esterase
MFPFQPTSRRARATPSWLKTLVAATLAVMAGCGGGTSQYEPFVPERLFAFGDEASALAADAPAGRNYGINGTNANNTPDDTSDDFIDCRLQPNWVQSVAAYYSFVFAECNPDNATDIRARNWAAPGARVAEAAAQVDAQVAAGGFRDKDIVTLMVGVNDVLEIYGRYDGTNEAVLLADVRERGNRTGLLVNRLVSLGAKVVVSNIQDLGYTPFAVKENAANPGSDRAGLLSRLSSAFNERLGVTMLLDGRYVALAQTDQRILAINRSPASFVVANTTDAACATPPPNCTNNTLVAGANPTTYLWAGDVLLSSRGQSEVASLALTRAQRNPF